MANSGHIFVPTPAIPRPEDITAEDLRHIGKENLAVWALASGVKVDNNVLDFNTHRYLIPIYSDNTDHIVWRKAAQLGATVYLLLKCLWWLESHQGRKAGLYFPTKEGVENLSKDRLGPMIDSCPSIKALCQETDKLGLKKIGDSSLYLMHLGGVSSKDSVPLDHISVDEVRLCNPRDIDQVLERIAHSPYKIKTFMSTSGHEGDTIDARFKFGNQLTWMSFCGCPDGCNLAASFPDCIVYDDPKRPKEVYMRCPRCKYEIKDAQHGRYVPMNPGADYNSYAVSQLVSKYITTKEIWDFYNRTTNMSEFYNSKLGLPYTDEANRGVTPDQLAACIDTTMSWFKPGSKEASTCMGVDQGTDYLWVTILDVHPDGTKKRVRHVEVIERSNPYYYEGNQPVSPFNRLHHLMKDFNVGMCVIDGLPNFSEALNFAQQYPGKVFLAQYVESNASKDTVIWNDKAKAKEGLRKAGPFLKFKYTCSINRYNALSLALGEWSTGSVAIPNPDALVQVMRNEKNGGLGPESPARRLFTHLLCYIRQFKETDDDTGRGTWQWIHTSQNDHGAHSFLYANVALERFRKRVTFTFME